MVLCGICVAAGDGSELAALLEQSESADTFVELHAERSPSRRVVVCKRAPAVHHLRVTLPR